MCEDGEGEMENGALNLGGFMQCMPDNTLLIDSFPPTFFFISTSPLFTPLTTKQNRCTVWS